MIYGNSVRRPTSAYGRSRGISTNDPSGLGVATIPPVHSPGECRMSGRALHHDIRGGGPRPPTPKMRRVAPEAQSRDTSHRQDKSRAITFDRTLSLPRAARNRDARTGTGSRRRSNLARNKSP